jgi:hypothetical protein
MQDTETNQKPKQRNEGKLSRAEAIVLLILQLDEAAGYDIPILSLVDTAEVSSYMAKGAFGKPLFIVCNKDEVAESLETKLNFYRKKRKEKQDEQP